MPAMSIDVFRVPTRGPGDVSGLMALIESDHLDPSSIIAVLGKTEGNGGVNDFTREYAVAALCAALEPLLGLSPNAVEARIAFVMSGGTEGVLSPHLTVFARKDVAAAADRSPDKRLSIGIAHTRDFLPEEIGRDAQIAETMQAVRLAMTDGGIEDPRDVHFVQIKCPLLTSERIEAAAARGHKTVTTGAYSSMGYSRGASAIGHAVMRDAIDLAAVMEAIRSAGLDPLDLKSQDRLVNIFAKAEASPDGLVRGFRHTMLEDTDITATRHARAAVGGLIGGVAGTGLVYVSGGAEHQGPAGGGPIAVIARR